MPNLLRIRSAFNALYSHRRSRAGHIIRDGLLALAIFGFLVAILASVFAVIFVFNLWFLRHLGRVHAASRPARNRKG